MIERTPLSDVGDLPLPLITSEAPALVEAILDSLDQPGPDDDPELLRAAANFATLRQGEGAASQIPRDLAALQAVLIEARRSSPEREPGDFARSVSRLAELFGAIQGTIAGTLAGEETAPVSGEDPLTGLPDSRHFDQWLRVLLAEQRRYGHPFALALIDVDGLSKVNDAYGREGGDRMLNAVAGVLRRQVREVDLIFRLEEDEFAILAPHTHSDRLVELANRVAALIARSQVQDGPRIAIATGIVDCPADGLNAERLLEAAAEATYAAKASGTTVGRSANAGHSSVLQDP